MNFDEFLQEQLKNPEFKKEYDALAPEYAVKRFLLSLHAGFQGVLSALRRLVTRGR